VYKEYIKSNQIKINKENVFQDDRRRLQVEAAERRLQQQEVSQHREIDIFFKALDIN